MHLQDECPVTVNTGSEYYSNAKSLARKKANFIPKLIKEY